MELLSQADILNQLPPEDKLEFLSLFSKEERGRLKYKWDFWARPEQIRPPGDWTFWAYIGGRGAGKTRTGAQYVLDCVADGCLNIALVAPTHDDFDKVMVNGPSGILACSPPWNMPEYNESKKTLTWPNGAQAFGYSAEKPSRLRGHNHDAAWADELAAWHPNRRQETWDMLLMTLREGEHPRCMVSTTPMPVDVISELMDDCEAGKPGYVLTTSSTYANRANLAKSFFDTVIKKYEGTRLGQQELEGKLLRDIPGALWNLDMIRANRVDRLPKIKRVMVAVDPSGASGKNDTGRSASDREKAASKENNDEIGIIIAAEDYNDEYYVIEDRSLLGGPDEWSQAAVDAYHDYGAALLVAETNYGGEMVISTIKRQDAKVKTKKVHASLGKAVRAAPIALLYEQNRVHHVGNREKFARLEDQLCKFTAKDYIGKGSPDRADAAIWALSELSGQTGGRFTMGTGTS